MIEIDKNPQPEEKEVLFFLNHINFKLPDGFIDFFKNANGADIYKDENYFVLWPITEMIQLNIDYNVLEYAKEFFIFGSDGGGNAYALERETGYIFKMPFIGMSKEEAVFICESFNEFLEKL